MSAKKLSDIYEVLYKLTFHSADDIGTKYVWHTSGSFDDAIRVAKMIEDDEQNEFNNMDGLVYLESIETVHGGFFVPNTAGKD